MMTLVKPVCQIGTMVYCNWDKVKAIRSPRKLKTNTKTLKILSSRHFLDYPSERVLTGMADLRIFSRQQKG